MGIPILIIIKSKNQYEKSNIYNCHYLSFYYNIFLVNTIILL